MSPQVLKMNNDHKVLCGCEICIYEYTMQGELNRWISNHVEKLILPSKISHSRISMKEWKIEEWINQVYLNSFCPYKISINSSKYIYCRYINTPPDSILNYTCVLGDWRNIKKTAIPE